MHILVAVVAFISEYLDSALGMGYGTALAPTLILMGYEPHRVVPAILISQLFTDVAAVVCHHQARNVDFKVDSADLRIALLLGLISTIGVLLSSMVAVRIPPRLVTIYIGGIVTVMGFLILITARKSVRFSMAKILGLSFLASFNKGISGGGYGPLIMGGQLLSGVKAKNAVGITAFAEAITCLVGFVAYYIGGRGIDWGLTWMVTAFAIPAVPLAAFTVKKIYSERLKKLAGVLIVVLGAVTLLKLTARP
jgi:uncharacterized protein